MLLTDYRPRAQLITNSTKIEKPRFSVIDAHNHLREPFGGGWDQKPLPLLIEQLDQAGIAHYVDLDGGWGEEILNQHLDLFKAKAPDRFHIFGGIDWPQWKKQGDDFPEWAAKRLRIQKERGAEGLKVWKDLGLRVHDHNDKLVNVDDPRLDPIWQTAAELELPVLIHVADPVAFFDPIDESNERWEELGTHADWAFTSPPFPPFMHILNGFSNLVSRHSETTFIGAHVGCYAENLDWVSRLLDDCPNLYVDIAERIAELGRKPYSARHFFLKYANRILFGLDLGPTVESYRISYRFLETDDEYFAYGVSDPPLQGRWNIYGLHLPDDVLEKVYSRNAQKILKL